MADDSLMQYRGVGATQVQRYVCAHRSMQVYLLSLSALRNSCLNTRLNVNQPLHCTETLAVVPLMTFISARPRRAARPRTRICTSAVAPPASLSNAADAMPALTTLVLVAHTAVSPTRRCRTSTARAPAFPAPRASHSSAGSCTPTTGRAAATAPGGVRDAGCHVLLPPREKGRPGAIVVWGTGRRRRAERASRSTSASALYARWNGWYSRLSACSRATTSIPRRRWTGEAAPRGSGMEEDGEVDVVSGGVAADPTRKDRVLGKTRQRESKREVVTESVCSPKMHKRWKADVPAPPTSFETNAPSPDNARESARTKARSMQTSAYLLHHCVSSSRRPHHPPRFGSPLAPPPPPGVLTGPSPNMGFALFSPMSPHASAGGPQDDSREDILLLTIGESYRPSPANPSPVPESEEEDELPIVPHTLGEEETAPVPAEHHPVLAPSEQAGFPATLQPPLPAWSNGSSISLSPEAPPAAPLVSEPSPPAVPPPAAKVSLKGVAVALQGTDSVAVLPLRFPFSVFSLLDYDLQYFRLCIKQCIYSHIVNGGSEDQRSREWMLNDGPAIIASFISKDRSLYRPEDKKRQYQPGLSRARL
ncbi:hypothetical protein B0H13DRAFT_2518856 [Mycena leptocephala]|nr:hypothetical protein B0H13DRAFT_2518856 [Mycena leptocephala]